MKQENVPLKNDQAPLVLTSTNFVDGAHIPLEYTCDGENISPQLSWILNSEKIVSSYVLIVDDPDAQKVTGKTFVHWIAIFSGSMTTIPQGISGTINSIDKDAQELSNHSGKTLYYGPCPAIGDGKHVYRFTLFGTDVPVKELPTKLSKIPCTAQECRQQLFGHIVAEALLTGIYAR